MSASFVFVVLLLGLFSLSYIMKRRFGVLGLALAAGALISEHWTGIVTPFLEQQGISVVSPPLAVVVAIGLTLLPAIILIFSGPSYGKGLERIIGSVLFAVLALVFIAPQISSELAFDSLGLTINNMISDYRPLIIVAGLAIAVADVFITRSPGKGARAGRKTEHR